MVGCSDGVSGVGTKMAQQLDALSNDENGVLSELRRLYSCGGARALAVRISMFCFVLTMFFPFCFMV